MKNILLCALALGLSLSIAAADSSTRAAAKEILSKPLYPLISPPNIFDLKIIFPALLKEYCELQQKVCRMHATIIEEWRSLDMFDDVAPTAKKIESGLAKKIITFQDLQEVDAAIVEAATFAHSADLANRAVWKERLKTAK